MRALTDKVQLLLQAAQPALAREDLLHPHSQALPRDLLLHLLDPQHQPEQPQHQQLDQPPGVQRQPFTA